MLTVNQDSRAFSLRGVFTLPMSKVSPHPLMKPVSLSAVLGATHWHSESHFAVDATGVPGGARNSVDNAQTGLDVMLGARVNYDVNEQVRVSGGWDRYRRLGRSSVATGSLVPPLRVETVDNAVDVFSVSVSYHFR